MQKKKLSLIAMRWYHDSLTHKSSPHIAQLRLYIFHSEIQWPNRGALVLNKSMELHEDSYIQIILQELHPLSEPKIRRRSLLEGRSSVFRV